MRLNSERERYAHYLRRKAAVTLLGLRPTALVGRLNGPRVLLNSIPKSGTHLLERTLELFPRLRHSGRRTLMGWEGLTERNLARLRAIRRGQYALAHMPAHDGLPELLHAEGIRTLFIVRDPRDVLVSRIKYVTEMHRVHPAHRPFASLPDDAARLMAAIEGVEGVEPSIGDQLARYAGWLDAAGVLVVRFEELIGERGGGDTEAQLAAVRRIAGFLELPVDEAGLRRIAGGVFSPRSSTFRVGRSGQWRRHFDARLTRTLERRAGALLVRYGYPPETLPER